MRSHLRITDLSGKVVLDADVLTFDVSESLFRWQIEDGWMNNGPKIWHRQMSVDDISSVQVTRLAS